MEAVEIGRIQETLLGLERRNRQLAGGLRASLVIWVATLACIALTAASSANRVAPDSVLRVRGLVVVDANGTERVWIGAPLPNPMTLGKRLKRQGAVSGILLMDAEGNERSGYVTAEQGGGVFFTLDSISEQQVLFLANPDGGVHLSMWDSNGNFARLGVFKEGPTLRLASQGKTVFQQPQAEKAKQ